MILLTKLMLLLLFPVAADELRPVPSPSVLQLLQKHTLSQEHLSYHLIPLDSPQKGFERSEKSLQLNFRDANAAIPASLVKALTTVRVLKDLPENKQFQTQLKYRGEINNGVLAGDIVLVGGGDPFLGHAQLVNLILAIKQRGIRRVEGNFYYDDSLYLTREKISDIGHGDQTYNPSIGPLSLEFNQFKAYRDNSHNWQTVPQIDLLEVKSIDDTFAQGKSFRSQKNKQKEIWQASRKQSYRNRENIPVRNPGLVASATFQWLAQKWGVELPEPQAQTPESSGQDYRVLATLSSKPLRDLTHAMMEFSNNLFAESLLLLWYQHTQKKPATSLEQAALEMLNSFKKEYPQIDLTQWKIVNASGLTTQSRVTARSLTELMARWSRLQFGETFFPSYLSISGHNGWMANRLDTPAHSLKVWAKTGSLDYVNNLTGILHTSSGKQYAFTILLQDLPRRQALDQLDNNESVESKSMQRLQQGASSWGRSARDFSNELLEHWIKTL